jgi:thiol:disulfide interchange protein DsbD
VLIILRTLEKFINLEFRNGKNLFRIFLILTMLALGPSKALAQGLSTEQAHSKATLITSQDALVPGQKIFIGIDIKLEDHWHTYWKNPGDSASAPILNIELPDQYETTPLLYGVPTRIPVPPLVSFGYNANATYGFELTIPKSEEQHLGVIRQFVIAAEWLVCRQECIPAFYDFKFDLTVKKSSNPTPFAKQLEQTFRSIEEQSPLKAILNNVGDTLTVSFKLPEKNRFIDLIPYPDQIVENNVATLNSIEDQTVSVDMQIKENSESKNQTLKVLAIWQDTETGELNAQTVEASPKKDSVATMMAFAFLGGLILNLMPCVFPILMLKFMNIVQMVGKNKRDILLSSLSYQGGVLVSLWLLSIILITTRQAGIAKSSCGIDDVHMGCGLRLVESSHSSIMIE